MGAVLPDQEEESRHKQDDDLAGVDQLLATVVRLGADEIDGISRRDL
jgi:hypothetical protein